MAKIRNDELAQLAGEVLPERTVLSAVPMDGGGMQNCSPNNQSDAEKGNWLSFISSVNQCGLSNDVGKSSGLSLLG